MTKAVIRSPAAKAMAEDEFVFPRAAPEPMYDGLFTRREQSRNNVTNLA